MGMLERIKKRQFDGFRDFVANLETTGFRSRSHILSLAILEDPIYMSYVVKNIKGFKDFLNLPGHEIELVLSTQQQLPHIFAKCLHGENDHLISSLKSTIPHFFSRLKDELNYVQNILNSEKEGAIFHLLKIVRSLQAENKIEGFYWQLPPVEVFHPRTFKDGDVSLFFDSGVLAAQGPYLKSQREGTWKHYYDNGKLFAEGEYVNGEKTGEWTYYFITGALKSRGHFKHDSKVGSWLEWDRTGVENLVVYNEDQSSSN
jgi:MORN repeat variant